MIKKLQLILVFAIGQLGYGQLEIDNATETPAELALNVFQGPGVVLSNIKYNGSAANANTISDQVGHFTNGNTTNLGLDSGVILATGKATLAIGPNNAGGASLVTSTPTQGDVDLALLSTNTIYNKACLEFDFVPEGTQLSFSFVFASEEYPEFANSQWNDVMGFFINGPGLSGPFSNNSRNIALILPSTTPIAINNLNNGTANLGPCEYCEFYVNNGTGNTPTVNNTIQYDGFTTVLSAKAQLIPGETYHLKIAIANAGDNSWDSALFLKANQLGGLSTAEFNAANNIWLSYPEKGLLLVQAGKHKQLQSITLFDLLGKKVGETKNILSDNIKIDVSALSNGIYAAEVVTVDNLKIMKKIIVQ